MAVWWFTYPPFDEHDFFARVLGRAPEMIPAILNDYKRVVHPAYTHVIANVGTCVHGSLVNTQTGDDWMLEAEFGVKQGYYRRVQLDVEVGDQMVQAWVLVAGPSLAWAVQGQEDTKCT